MVSVLLSACSAETRGDNVKNLCELYDEFDSGRLQLQLQMLPSFCSGHPQSFTSVSAFAAFFRTKPLEVQSLVSVVCEVEWLLQLLLVVPASSATADRSFSCLRRLKTYLRNTMSRARLNHMALLNVHQERVDSLRIADIQGQFIHYHESRLKLFGCSSNAFRE